MPSTAPRVHRVPLRGGDEYDAFTGWRRLLRWKPGERKAIKQRYNRRLHRPLSTVPPSDAFLPGVKFGKLENVYRRPDGRFDFLPDEPN